MKKEKLVKVCMPKDLEMELVALKLREEEKEMKKKCEGCLSEEEALSRYINFIGDHKQYEKWYREQF